MFPLCILLLLISCKQEQTLLRLGLHKGQIFERDISTSEQVILVIGGTPLTSGTSMKNSILFQVMEVRDSTYLLDFNYHSLSITYTVGTDSSTHYNSETPQLTDTLSIILRDLKTRHFKVVMNKKGKVLTVENADTIKLELMDKYWINLNGPNAGAIRDIIEKYDGNSVATVLENMTLDFPKRSISTGEIWKAERHTNHGSVPLIATTIYTYKGNSKEEAQVSYTAKLQSPPFINSKKIFFMYNLTGESSGDINIDPNSGMVSTGKHSLHVHGELNFINESRSLDGKPIPTDITIEMTIEKVTPEESR